MAKTKGTPGPKPGTTKKYGKRRDYHFRLLEEVQKDEVMSLADAFDAESGRYGGDNAYINEILRERPEIARRLKGETNNA